ncbi:hypothetical protein LCGC14_1753410 [marine sediment metagenome]|uniref:Uncharacterized protein n=1 Tax=marine sediment metagenome TaxID=412755 RepID=A0A0F9HQL1_9ZZZZ
MPGFEGQPKEAVEAQAYVGFRTECGHAVAAAVIQAEHLEDTGEFVKEMKASGLTVEIRTVEWVRENLNCCDCDAANHDAGGPDAG